MAAIGPTFLEELRAAGLDNLPISWDAASGTILGRDRLTPAQNTALDAVLAAHDPKKQSRDDLIVGDPERQDLVDRLRSSTPAQIKAYVQNNITDLASAKTMIARILLILARS